MLDVLQKRGLSVNAIGIGGKGPIIEGNPSLGRTVDVLGTGGVNLLSRRSLTDQGTDLDGIEPIMEYMNKDTSLESGVFGNYWAQNLIDTLDKSRQLDSMLDNQSLSNSFSGGVGNQLRIVAKMILLNEAREVNRDVFMVGSGGHDSHALSKQSLNDRLPDINGGVTAFYNEMRDQGMLDQVTLVMMSEFGRTITPNTGRGSDHAWGGNAFVMSGEIDAKILGQYPHSFANTDPAQIGRGRLIPSRSWESMWYGIANWFDISSDEDMKEVLPNNGNMGCDLYTDSDMYTVGNNTINGCNDRFVEMKLGMLIDRPRYLTGIEQKRICNAAINLVSQNANVVSRCIIVDQKVIVNFDFARRVLSAEEFRNLQDFSDVANITLDADVAFLYDNPVNSTNGTDYVENSVQFATDMNDEITGGAGCTGTERRGRRRLEECTYLLDNVLQLYKMEAIVTESPSGQPSSSSLPSSSPSFSPSESSGPSVSFPPSPKPSATPSISAIPTDVSSLSPSESSGPSVSFPPSPNPSAIPSITVSPTPPFPSSKPSVAPSSRPSRDCPNVLDECFNGGMWSPFTCECLCPSPHCPDANSGWCTETACPADYHETFLEGQEDPWFEFGSSCTATKELPSNVNAIYRSKKDCCEEEYPNNSGGCVARPAGVMQLAYSFKLQLQGLVCPGNGSERDAAAAIMANSVLASLCSQVTGLTCGDGDKVVLTLFCGEDFSIEKVYSSSTRRLQEVVEDNVVDFTFFSQSLASDELEGIEALLSSYLSGSTLETFLATVLADVLASDPPPSLQSLIALSYTSVNAFIAGLGLYYPAWGKSETCLSDGKQEPYMNGQYGNWLYETLDSCCQRYFGWDEAGCKVRHAETTLVSGTIPATVDPTEGLYFPDWERTDTCINDGTAPPYMKKAADLWMYDTLRECCQGYYGWKDGFAQCMLSQGGDPPTRSPIPESWYVNWKEFVCVESCEGDSPCGGVHEPWDILHGSKSQCCETHLWWKEGCMEL